MKLTCTLHWSQKFTWNGLKTYKAWNLTFLEQNREKLLVIGPGSAFLDMTPKAQASKAELDRQDYIKIMIITFLTWHFTKEVGNLKVRSIQNIILLSFPSEVKELNSKEVYAYRKVLESKCI